MMRKSNEIEKLQMIHVDELPERCRVNIRQFLMRALRDEIETSLDDSYRIPGNCIVLAHKSKGKTRYPKWQVSFLPQSEISHFKQSNPDYRQRYYRVWGDIF